MRGPRAKERHDDPHRGQGGERDEREAPIGHQHHRRDRDQREEIAEDGPFSVTKTYQEIADGRLIAFYAGTRRMVLAIDYARWLLLMKRESATDDKADQLEKTDLNLSQFDTPSR